MTYLIVNDGTGYQIASLIESYKNNALVEIYPNKQKRKIKPEQQIFQLSSITTSNIAQFKQQLDEIVLQIDITLLSELLEEDYKQFKVEELAELYFGDGYSQIQQVAMLFALKKHMVIFKDHNNGTFNKRTIEEQQEQQRIILEKEQQELVYNNYYTALVNQQNPNFDNTIDIIRLLNRPDKQSAEYQALLAASKTLSLTPLEVCYNTGLVTDLAEFHIKSFLFENFRHGVNHTPEPNNQNLKPIELHNRIETNFNIKVFSIDDNTTTEIDDAFSVQQNETHTIVGIHIAAPALNQDIANIVCDNISTIYYPGDKITMLPQDIINEYSLNENKTTAVVSIYFVLDQELTIIEYYSKLETVKINHNLRIEELELIFNDISLQTEHNYPYESELKLLYNFATKLEETRGKPSVNNLIIDYNFSFDSDNKISIKPRIRGNPIDKLVSELMILANCTWGRMLTNAFIPAIYRVKQPNFPVKMTLTPDSHTGLHVDYYTWSTSPLRRSADYINQYQIINLITKQKSHYTAVDPTLLHVVENFDAQYAKYLSFQEKMERYWSLKYLIQENITDVVATFTHKSKVQLDCVPIEIDTQSVTTAKPKGTQIKIKLFNINLINLSFDFKILESNVSA